MTNKTITLAPDLACPFCGSKELKQVTDDGIHFTQCKSCEATGPTGFKRGEDEAIDWNTRAALADPVPPAGGEVEVFRLRIQTPCSPPEPNARGLYRSDWIDAIKLSDHRAHVTRLQAEVERLKEEWDLTALTVDTVQRKADQLQESLQLEQEATAKWQETAIAMGAQQQALQSELTKARELLNQAHPCTVNDDPELSLEIGTFLSNQSAPAAKGEECVHDFRMFSGECHKCGADWIPGKEYAPAEKGEPVAFPGYPPVPEDRKLPADQPAPVAVSLPERKTVKAGLLSESNTHNQGWNACLDEFARLNPIKQ